jgi:hypothetical protein
LELNEPMLLRDLPPEIQKLAQFGDTADTDEWLDYREQGVGPEYIPDLIDVIDHTTHYWEEALDETDPLGWVPVHAWRALGQLQAVEAMPALLNLLSLIKDYDSDLIQEELPEVFQVIGPDAIEPLSQYLLNPNQEMWARLAAADGLEQIACEYPETRSEVVDILTRALQNYRFENPIFNGFILCFLANQKAMEAGPLAEEVYLANLVDESVPGDWEDFQVAVGLLKKRLTPAQPHLPYDFSEGLAAEETGKVRPSSVRTVEYVTFGQEQVRIRPDEKKNRRQMSKEARLSHGKSRKKKKKKNK